MTKTYWLNENFTVSQTDH